MLQVYHSNRLELLFEIYCAQRAVSPLEDPFQADQVLVANPGIGRWLSLQLADREGIAANIDYPLPASFVWKLYRAHLPNVPEHSAFNKPRLQWVLMELLADLPSAEVYEPLRLYMRAEEASQALLKRVQLAAKISDVLDQYLVYRPDWLLEWESGSTPSDAPGNWQAHIWRELRRRLDEPHRATLHAAFCAAAKAGKLDKSQLPERLCIFNVVSIPPSYLDVLTALAQHIQVDLYLLNPSVEFWDEITDRKRVLKKRKQKGADASLDDGNPLLAATGRLGQHALRLLHERGQFIHEENFSVPNADDGRLARLQRDVLELTQPAREADPQIGLLLPEQDHSIEVHSAHGVLREVQILHDQLLARFERIEGLTPADVIVMVPNVDKYTAAVSAVFGSAPAERHIPWEIADRSLTQTDPVVSLLRALLDLPQSAFSASEVLGWLSQPVIARRFGLEEPEAQLCLARWVIDSNTRRQLGTGAGALAGDTESPLNSWAFGLRRLLAGYAAADTDIPVGSVYPATALEGSQAELLGRLIDCLERLEHWRKSLNKPRTMQAWIDAFNGLVGDLCEPDENDNHGIQQLRECLGDLVENAEKSEFTEILPSEGMLALLDNALAGISGKTQRFLTGKVTISSMVPLRSVPFRVVCLLGLNDGEFPRQNRPVSFDLIPANPRIGDRSVREDDHYLFLEAILSARDELYLSWLGRDASENKEQAPSVLLAELIDYFRFDHETLQNLQHPLQAYSAQYFDEQDTTFSSYAAQWLPGQQEARATLAGTVAEPGDVELGSLLRFWTSPSRFYCRDILRLRLYGGAEVPEDTEPFDLNALEQYKLRVEQFDGLVQETPVEREQAFDTSVGRGELPHGAFAEKTFARLYDESTGLAARYLQEAEEPLEAEHFTVEAHDWQITGKLGPLSSKDGKRILVMTRPGSFNGKNLINIGLHHLIGCAAGILEGSSIYVARDKNHQLRWVDKAEAVELLSPWLEHYANGHAKAVPFFPATSLAALDGFKQAAMAWNGGDYSSAEADDEAIQLLWPELQNPCDLEGFEELAEAVMAPLKELLKEKKNESA